MNSDETQKLVTEWYSREDIWKANSATYPKSPEYIDYKLLYIPSMVTGRYVLNLGCCYPSDEMQFSETVLRWDAIDISSKVVERAKNLVNKANVNFIQMDMRTLKYPDHWFDTVLDFSSGDHLLAVDYVKVISEVYRVLFYGGVFVITYANLKSFPEENYYGDFGYFRATDPNTMKSWVRNAGFQVTREITDGDRAGLVANKL